MKTEASVATLCCMCSVEKEHRSKSDYKTQDKEKRLKSAYGDKRMQKDSAE